MNTLISLSTYTYDTSGRKTSVGLDDGARSSYVYDASSQLRGERHTPAGMITSTLTTFVYDPAGNRSLLNENGTRTTSTYDAANRLKYSVKAAGRTTYSYDANGNQTRILEPNLDRTTFSWTYENQQRLVELPDDSVVTSIWAPVTQDADEYRVEQETEDSTTKYVWDRHNIIQERDELNVVEAEYTYAPQAYGDLISQRRGSESSIYHFDALGSTLALTDASQVVTDSAFYKAFGEAWTSTGTTKNSYLWIGQIGYYHDEATGQDSLRARIYRTDQVRFTSEDPAEVEANLFRYTRNNPINSIDPSGLDESHHPYPLHLGGRMSQVCINLTDNQHKAIHSWFRARGFPYGPVGRAKWGLLSSRQQQAMIIRSLRAVGVQNNLIRTVIADCMKGAFAGKLTPRIGTRGPTICGAVGGAILIVLTEPGILQAAEWSARDLEVGECKCAEYTYVSTDPAFWNFRTWSEQWAWSNQIDVGPATRSSSWLSFGEMTRQECNEMSGFNEVISSYSVLGYTVNEIVYTSCKFTRTDPPADALAPENG